MEASVLGLHEEFHGNCGVDNNCGVDSRVPRKVKATTVVCHDKWSVETLIAWEYDQAVGAVYFPYGKAL